MSPCILHCSGHLRVERCQLTCYSGGLDHLSSPIVTVAASAPLNASAATFAPAGPAAAAVIVSGSSEAEAEATSSSSLCTALPAAPTRPVKQRRTTPVSVSLTGRFSIGAGPGKLVVADTRLSGGGKGVRCLGTGALQGVRAIYGAGRMPLFFFEVDARSVPVVLPDPPPASR